MIKTIIPFILSLLAGLSTLLGMLVIFIKNKSDKIIPFSLSFAAGVMVCVSFLDLIPESIEMLKDKFQNFPLFIIILIFITTGILLSIFIDKLFPSTNDSYQSKLYQVGLISMIAIILHNIPEGIITFLSANNKLSLGLTIAIAIALHNIPEGISIAVPIYYSTNSKKKTFFYTFLSAISEPFGAIIAYLFLKPYINNMILGFLFSLVAGIMLHISFYELLPTSLSYKNKKITYVAFLIGFLFMYFSRCLLSI